MADLPWTMSIGSRSKSGFNGIRYSGSGEREGGRYYHYEMGDNYDQILGDMTNRFNNPEKIAENKQVVPVVGRYNPIAPYSHLEGTISKNEQSFLYHVGDTSIIGYTQTESGLISPLGSESHGHFIRRNGIEIFLGEEPNIPEPIKEFINFWKPENVIERARMGVVERFKPPSKEESYLRRRHLWWEYAHEAKPIDFEYTPKNFIERLFHTPNYENKHLLESTNNDPIFKHYSDWEKFRVLPKEVIDTVLPPAPDKLGKYILRRRSDWGSSGERIAFKLYGIFGPFAEYTWVDEKKGHAVDEELCALVDHYVGRLSSNPFYPEYGNDYRSCPLFWDDWLIKDTYFFSSRVESERGYDLIREAGELITKRFASGYYDNR